VEKVVLGKTDMLISNLIFHVLFDWRMINVRYDENTTFERKNYFSVTITLNFKTSPCINASIVWRLAVSCLVWNYNVRFKVGHNRGHNLSKSGEWHIILALSGFILTCCDILIGFG